MANNIPHSPADENTPLLDSDCHAQPDKASVVIDEEAISPTPSSASTHELPPHSAKSIVTIISALLIAVFISNADGSLVLATHTIIASHFDKLGSSSWLFISYALAQCAAQPLYGKLSDIYGRKPVLIISYILFTVGCAICGIGTTFPQIIFGRALSGIGGGGMTSLVSILLTDLVPLRDIALWRSYVNIIATTGRSLGGPLGGYLADTIGWRWSFFAPCPIMVLAILLCWVLVPKTQNAKETAPSSEENGGKTRTSKLGRIDFLGSTLLTLTILLFLAPLSLGGQTLPWSSPYIASSFTLGIVTALLFLLTEAYIATSPIFPLSLLKNLNVLTSYTIFFLQTSAQLGVMYTIPIYFQVTESSSATVAGAHLMPAVIGNAVGGILSGIAVKKTGKYKSLIISATITSAICYLLLLLRWHGHTNFLESLYVFPGGFGTGVAQSAVFVALTASLSAKDMAVATSGLYLMGSGGMVAGLAVASAVLQGVLRVKLQTGLRGVHGAKRIQEGVLSDIALIRNLKGDVKEKVVGAYVSSLEWTHSVSLSFAVLATIVGILVREYEL